MIIFDVHHGGHTKGNIFSMGMFEYCGKLRRDIRDLRQSQYYFGNVEFRTKPREPARPIL
jgi:hypothetical protein